MVITEMVGLPVAQAQINVVKVKEIVTVMLTALVVLTLKEPEYFGCLKAGGGLNQPTTVFVLLCCQFPCKSTQTPSQMKAGIFICL